MNLTSPTRPDETLSEQIDVVHLAERVIPRKDVLGRAGSEAVAKWADLIQLKKRQYTPCNLLRVAFLIPPRNMKCHGGLSQSQISKTEFRQYFGYEPHWSREVMSVASMSRRVDALAASSFDTTKTNVILQRGTLRLCLGQPKAQHDLAFVVEHAPVTPALQGHFLLSRLLTDTKQVIKDDLIPQFLKFVTAHQREPVGHLGLFKSYAELQDINAARSAMTRGLELHPNNFALLAAAAWFSTEHDEPLIALRLAQKSFLMFPENDLLWPSLLRFQRGGHSKMREHLRKCYGPQYVIEDLSLRAPPWWISPNLADLNFSGQKKWCVGRSAS